VVLFELLSGQHPYRMEGRAPHEVAQAVCEFEPEKPSVVGDRSQKKLHRDLRGDLDNIVLMALRKEPSRRYSSTEHLAADIRRTWIISRAGTQGYWYLPAIKVHQAPQTWRVGFYYRSHFDPEWIGNCAPRSPCRPGTS
jgi:hypothetical protein